MSKEATDLERQMMSGCSGFLVAAFGSFLLSIWPFFLSSDLHRLATLARMVAMGMLPAFALGIVITRRFALAGACGFVGGAMATGVFLLIRLQQIFMAALVKQSPEPDYPSSLIYLAPLACILLAIIVAIAVLPPEKELPR